ncbi:MAG TPA: hypothetical protein VGN34_10635, partial [Ktedonobacteraceae bacterium]
MAKVDKVGPKPGRETRKPTQAEKDATKVTVLGIEALKTQVLASITAMDNHDKQANILGQELILLCMKHHNAELLSNSRPNHQWKEYVTAKRSVSDAGRDWIKRFKADYLAKIPNKSTVKNPTDAAARNKISAQHTRVTRHCEMAIALGNFGTDEGDFDPKRKMFSVDVSLFLPVTAPNTKPERQWSFRYGEKGKVLLAGGGSAMARKGKLDSDPEEIEPVSFNLAQVHKRFFATPEHLRTIPAGGNQDGGRGVKKGGAVELTAIEQRKYFAAMDIITAMRGLGVLIAAHTGKEAVKLDHIRGDKKANDALNALLMIVDTGKADELN